MFTREIKYDLVTLGCNVQWFKLMKTCVKIGSANDSRNLTRAIELFIFSDFTPENRFEYPVDFVSRHGDLQMFFTCMKLAGFDINDKFNHPIVKNKIIPYAAQHQNWPIATYLITKMDMEFRISLLENALAEHDENLVRTVLPLVTPEFYNFSVAELFEQRRLQELFLSRKSNYDVVSKRILHFLDIKALFVFRSASKKFQIAVDRETKMWEKIYKSQREALRAKFEKIRENVPVQWANDGLNAISFVMAQWEEFIEKIENLKNLSHTRYLSQIYNRLNDIIKVTNLIPLNFQYWILVQRWQDLVSPISFCLNESSTELLFELILPHLDIPASEILDHNGTLIERVIASENLELLKIAEPYINLDLTLSQGSNVFHFAAEYGTIEIFQYLRKNAKAADPRLQNASAYTPYDLANSDEMRQYLESINLN